MATWRNTLKKIFAIIFVLATLISACNSSSSATTPSISESASPVTQVPTVATVTEIPSSQPFTPTPTLSLPVSQLTPVPSSNTKITAENVKDLQEIAKYYGEIKYFAKVTKDKKFLFILDPDGLTKYDYASMESIAYVAVANSVSDLQISDDGDLLILDNNWLLNLKNEKEPKVQVLSEKIHLLNFYSRDFALSPDGSLFAVEQVHCYDACEHIFSLISTDDFKVLSTQNAPTYQQLGSFSPDGKYFSLVDLTIETHPDGSTNPGGASVGVWATNDFAKISGMSVKFPFQVSSIAFSEDNTLLAIAQENSIDVYDIPSGAPQVTIADLCKSATRKVMFAPSSANKLLEHSDCSSGEWTISGSAAKLSNDNVPELYRIAFDEKGDFKEILYPQPTDQDIKPHIYDHLIFLNHGILSFKYSAFNITDDKSCDFSLATGSFDCQSRSINNNNGQFLGEDIILATDGKYYRYVVGKNKVDIYSLDNPNQVYYSIPFHDYLFELLALDPINNLIFYNISLTYNYSKSIIQDMKNDRILEKWEGQTSISSLAISENSKYATFCLSIGHYNDGTDKDRLVIFDLSEKRTVHKTNFNCNGIALALSSDGTKLVSEHGEGATPITAVTRVMIVNTTPPYETKHFDFDSWFYPYAVVFSPDGSMLATGCSKNEICFLDPSDGREIYRLRAHSGISSLAFSKDGNTLATSSNWGLISLWAVPPFISNARQPQSSPISSNTPGFSWNFDEDGNFEGWAVEDWQSAGLKNLEVKDGNLSATATENGTAIYLFGTLGIDTTKFTRIEIRMRVSAGSSAQVLFTYGDGDWTGDKGKPFSVTAGTEFNTYIIDMSNVAGWKGTVNELRIDPIIDAIGATMDIDYIRILP
jgi:WD40 repeat protein